ncbi:hypothetical protein AAFF39_06005 [Lactococcus garvieae]
MTLGRYSSNNGAFFTMAGNTQVNVVATAVAGSGVAGSNPQAQVQNFAVNGSTPTQWGFAKPAVFWKVSLTKKLKFL